MAWLGFFKPKFKHSNPDVRKQALCGLEDQAVLADIMENDPDAQVRRLSRYKHSGDQALLLEIAMDDALWEIRLWAVTQMTDQNCLAEIARRHPEFEIREEAVQHLTDQKILRELLDTELGGLVRTRLDLSPSSAPEPENVAPQPAPDPTPPVAPSPEEEKKDKVPASDGQHAAKAPPTALAPNEKPILEPRKPALPQESAPQPPEPTSPVKMPPKIRKERDNAGFRLFRITQAASFWSARENHQTYEPFLRYTFDKEIDARDALLAVNGIHEALDTGNLICTRNLVFGYYRREDGKYEAVVSGDELSATDWTHARTAFIRHGGHKEDEFKPGGAPAGDPNTGPNGGGKVAFIREYSQLDLDRTWIYRIHKGPSAASARDFLENQLVEKDGICVVVKTPEGDFCRDITGIRRDSGTEGV